MNVEPLSFMEAIVRRVQLHEQDKELLNKEAEWGKTIAPQMADVFYDYLGRDEEMNAILHAKEGCIHRLRQTFIQWFYEMFTGIDGWGKAYADSRWKIWSGACAHGDWSPTRRASNGSGGQCCGATVTP